MNIGFNRFILCLFVLVMVLAPFQATAADLTAGDVDDNLNYQQYLQYIDHVKGNSSELPSLNLGGRVTIQVVDRAGAGVSNALIKITIEGAASPLISSRTGTDGIFQFFPDHDGAKSASRFIINASAPDGKGPYSETTLDLAGLGPSRFVTLSLKDFTATLPAAIDMALVIDCTGSMTDELRYLTTEFGDIVTQVQSDNPNVSMRFGLVVYRDEGDVYVVKKYAFTDSVQTMRSQLSEQKADGGGDYEEAVHRGLKAGVNDLQWRGGNTLRMLFHVADAPPHNNYLDNTIDVVDDARAKGIHMFPLAASGVGDTAEYIMRAEAALTGGRYMFLTDDSGIGNEHAEPHIPCYIVTSLDNLFVRIVQSQLSGTRVEPVKADVIRTGGNYTKGVCLVEDTGSSTPKLDKLLSAGLPSKGGPMAAMPSMTFPMVCAAVVLVLSIQLAARRLRKDR